MKLKTRSAHRVPLALSLISAGPAAEIGEDFRLLDINELVTRGREGYIAFELTGDSAIPDIQPGNLVFVDTWAMPRNGDVIASSVNGLTCIKIFQNSSKGLYLISKNTAYKPREITEKDTFHVLGVVRGHLAIYP